MGTRQSWRIVGVGHVLFLFYQEPVLYLKVSIMQAPHVIQIVTNPVFIVLTHVIHAFSDTPSKVQKSQLLN